MKCHVRMLFLCTHSKINFRFINLVILTLDFQGEQFLRLSWIFFHCLCQCFCHDSGYAICAIMDWMLSVYRTLSWRWSWSQWRETWQRNRSYLCLLREYCFPVFLFYWSSLSAKFTFGVKNVSECLPNPPVNVFRKALESLAGRESGEPQRVREQAQRDMDALREAFNKRIADLEQVSQNYLLFSVHLIVVGGIRLTFLPHFSVCKQQKKRLTRWQLSPSRRSSRILTWRSSSKHWVNQAPSTLPLSPAQSKTCIRPCRRKTSRDTVEEHRHIHLLFFSMCL